MNLVPGRLVRRWGPSAAAVLSGAAVAASLPPWGWWPLALVGLAGWEALLAGQRALVRARRTWWFAIGWLAPCLVWMWQFSVPGSILVLVWFATYPALAVLALPGPPGDRWRGLGLAGALTAAEALRGRFPFGGMPMASLALGQAGGPLASLGRVGGPLLITWVTALIGTNARRILRGAARLHTSGTPQVARAVSATMVVLGLGAVTVVAPSGTATGRTAAVAIVQGGGPVGTRAVHTRAQLVLDRALAETEAISGHPDLVVWPENVVNVAEFSTSAALHDIAAQAQRLGAAFSVGITENAPDPHQFLNAQVVVDPDGTVISRYDKKIRVPFGEYIPWRALLGALGISVATVPRDAVPGTTPAVLDTPVGTVGVMISWEDFFASRAREAVRHGGEVLINPTNDSSYRGTIVQTEQLAASRLRAIETGRWVVQVSPTGFSAFVSPSGRIWDRTAQSVATWKIRTIELRQGWTWYTRLGDGPILAVIVAAWLAIMYGPWRATLAALRTQRRASRLPTAPPSP